MFSCRHENIMHTHAVFLADGDLHIVMPRLYVLKDLIEMYRQRKSSEVIHCFFLYALHVCINVQPIPVRLIAMIIRQLCHALDYLQRAGLMHRDGLTIIRGDGVVPATSIWWMGV